jgi:hypothetical protein
VLHLSLTSRFVCAQSKCDSKEPDLMLLFLETHAVAARPEVGSPCARFILRRCITNDEALHRGSRSSGRGQVQVSR